MVLVCNPITSANLQPLIVVSGILKVMKPPLLKYDSRSPVYNEKFVVNVPAETSIGGFGDPTTDLLSS